MTGHLYCACERRKFLFRPGRELAFAVCLSLCCFANAINLHPLEKSERQSENSGVATLNQNKPSMTDQACSTDPTCSSPRVAIASLDCPAQSGWGKGGHMDLWKGILVSE